MPPAEAPLASVTAALAAVAPLTLRAVLAASDRLHAAVEQAQADAAAARRLADAWRALAPVPLRTTLPSGW